MKLRDKKLLLKVNDSNKLLQLMSPDAAALGNTDEHSVGRWPDLYGNERQRAESWVNASLL